MQDTDTDTDTATPHDDVSSTEERQQARGTQGIAHADSMQQEHHSNDVDETTDALRDVSITSFNSAQGEEPSTTTVLPPISSVDDTDNRFVTAPDRTPTTTRDTPQGNGTEVPTVTNSPSASADDDDAPARDVLSRDEPAEQETSPIAPTTSSRRDEPAEQETSVIAPTTSLRRDSAIDHAEELRRAVPDVSAADDEVVAATPRSLSASKSQDDDPQPSIASTQDNLPELKTVQEAQDAQKTVAPPPQDDKLPTTAAPASDEDKVASNLAADQPATATQPPLTSPPLPSKQATLPPPPVPGKTTTTTPTTPTATHDERNAVAKAFGVQQARNVTPDATPTGIRIGKGPPPSTNPEEEKPFDFNTFLDQMKDPSARGVGEYVRSFIRGFSKKPYRTADQIKLIFDFLDFIAERMRQAAVWARLSEADFENAREAMEKLVMNRLYTFTFTPAVAKEARWPPQTDDLERDRVLRQRIELFSWLSEEHLDVPTGDHSRGFVDFAIQELLKINHYKAPRDKLICILNCCKVIFGLIRHMSEEENADTFIPVLIFVVLKANPEHLISNVEYIARFRNPEKLSSESGYYLSSLMGATAFIETMDYSSLSNITQEDFEKNVEAAVAKMAARPPPAPPTPPMMPSSSSAHPEASLLAPAPPHHNRTVSASDPHAPLGLGEGSATNLPGPNPSNPNAASFADDTRAFLQRTGEAARLGFSTSLGKPIGALGKLLGEGIEGIKTPGSGPNSSVVTPARVESPALNAALRGEKASGDPSSSGPSAPTPRRGGVFSSLFGGEPSSPTSRAASGSSTTSTGGGGGGFNPGSWGRRAGTSGYDDEYDEYDDDDDGQVPQTPLGTDNRQGPFSSLVRNPKYSDAAPPARRIGQTPYAPKAPRNRPPPPERSDSLDPFNSPDVSGTVQDHHGRRHRTASSNLSRRADESDEIGTPSDAGSDVDESTQGGDSSGVLSQARRRLPDLGAFVPSFLSETNTSSSPPRHFTRGPGHAQPAFPGESSWPPSDAIDDDVERVQQEQIDAAVDTLKSVFPDTDDEVRRMVLEACGGDVGQAIDRLLEINQG